MNGTFHATILEVQSAIIKSMIGAIPYLILPALLLQVLLTTFRGLSNTPRKNPNRFIVRKPLLTGAETKCLGLLERALPECRIFVQVAMGALLKPRSGLRGGDALSVRGRFAQKIVDFVVVHKMSGDVLAIVELDDASHDAAKDARRDAMLEAGGYRVVRFTARPWPTAASIAAAIHHAPDEARALA